MKNRRKGKPPLVALALMVVLAGFCFATPAQARPSHGDGDRGRSSSHNNRDRSVTRRSPAHHNSHRTVVKHKSSPVQHHAVHRPVAVNHRPAVAHRRPVAVNHRPAPRVVHHTVRHYPSWPRSGFYFSIPIGSVRLTIGGGTYYRHGSTYYRRTYYNNRPCYVVARPPVIVSNPTVVVSSPPVVLTGQTDYRPAVGTVVDYIPPDHDTIVVNGTSYILYNHTYYLPIVVNGYQKYIVVENPLN